jgi:hypothetical protein
LEETFALIKVDEQLPNYRFVSIAQLLSLLNVLEMLKDIELLAVATGISYML